MIKPGKKQLLVMTKKVDFGAYFAEEMGAEEEILLPAKEVPEDLETGDPMELFIYRDSKDRLIATTRTPKLQLGETALLTVKETGRIGAFLDWGLEKDLLLPFKEQVYKVQAGDECLVALYLDKSSRLCATMKVYPYLLTESPYEKDAQVTGRVYEISPNFGTFVAVDDRYSGLIPKTEAAGKLRTGDVITARVTAVKPDGKLDLSLREKAYMQMDTDAEMVLDTIRDFDGILPFDDKAAPEVIQTEFGLSKSAFKRAVGRLLKQGKIEIGQGKIRIK